MNIISEKDGLKLDIDKKETYRYLGYHFGGEVPLDDELEKMVDELTQKIKEVITPRCTYEVYQLEIADNICMLSQFQSSSAPALNGFGAGDDISGNCNSDSHIKKPKQEILLSINSVKLSAHLKECRYAILFAATIGPGADMLIRRYSRRSTIKPAILQAAGAAAIEAFADEVTERIRTEVDALLSQSGITSTTISLDNSISSEDTMIKFKMRFSPGYGDFSLEHQNDFFRLLQLEKNLGMSLNSALLMSPSKSITAVIGVI